MKKLIFLLVTCYLLLVTGSVVLAVSPSPSTDGSGASPTPKSTTEETNSATSSSKKDDEIKARVQERIEGIKNRIFEQAFWGTLIDINNSTLIVKTAKGERIIKTNEETKIIDQSKKAVKIADLEIGNFLIVNGATEQDTFTAKRVVVLKTTPKPKAAREVAHGKITKITEKTKLLNLTYKDQSFKITVNNKTLISKKVDDKMSKLAFTDLAENDNLVAVGTIDENTGIITTKIIHVIPGKTGSDKLSPTPSASVGASPTIKVSPTPSVKPSPTPTQKPTPNTTE